MDPQGGLTGVEEPSPDPPSGTEHDEPHGPGALVDRARTKVSDTWARVEDARPRFPVLDAAFDVRAYDQEVAGGLLAGALAFRLFLWLVPFALVLVTAAGWLVRDTNTSQADLASRYGITGIAASYVEQASRQSTTSRFLLLVIGLYFLYLASLGAVRALRVAHVLAWRLPTGRFTGTLIAALWFAGTGIVFALAALAENAVRQKLPGPGLVLLVLMIALIAAIWLVASWKLPHPAEASIVDLVPGTIVFAVGAELLHLVTVLWYGHKLEHSSELYGGLGAAVGLLAWLYLLGRLAMTSAIVNATLWRRKHGNVAIR
jgi:uncharacterized BrkB/YihY/UPF0761 family membrane protein